MGYVGDSGIYAQALPKEYLGGEHPAFDFPYKTEEDENGYTDYDLFYCCETITGPDGTELAKGWWILETVKTYNRGMRKKPQHRRWYEPRLRDDSSTTTYNYTAVTTETSFALSDKAVITNVDARFEPINGTVISGEAYAGTAYSCIGDITNGTASGAIAYPDTEEVEVIIYPEEGHNYPATVSLSNASYQYDENSGTVTLTNITGNVVVTATCPVKPTYTITPTISNGSYSGDTEIVDNASGTITPSDGYNLPESISVENANYDYDNTTGEVSFSAPTGNVTFSATCVSAEPTALTQLVLGNSTNGIQFDTSLEESDVLAILDNFVSETTETGLDNQDQLHIYPNIPVREVSQAAGWNGIIFGTPDGNGGISAITNNSSVATIQFDTTTYDETAMVAYLDSIPDEDLANNVYGWDAQNNKLIFVFATIDDEGTYAPLVWAERTPKTGGYDYCIFGDRFDGAGDYDYPIVLFTTQASYSSGATTCTFSATGWQTTYAVTSVMGQHRIMGAKKLGCRKGIGAGVWLLTSTDGEDNIVIDDALIMGVYKTKQLVESDDPNAEPQYEWKDTTVNVWATAGLEGDLGFKGWNTAALSGDVLDTQGSGEVTYINPANGWNGTLCGAGSGVNANVETRNVKAPSITFEELKQLILARRNNKK